MAIHECGHALVAAAYPELQVDFLRLSANGRECQTSGAEHFHTKATMHRDRVILMGGRVAEELVSGEISSGAGGDTEPGLAKATLLAETRLEPMDLVKRGSLARSMLFGEVAARDASKQLS